MGAFAQTPPVKPATAAGATAPANPGIAPTPEGAGRPLHPWQVPQNALTAEAYFTNVQSGASIETPFLLKFGLSGGWGLAPISQPSTGKAGHHHLLINRELPLDFKKPLPFNDQYIHFGKGQMETVLNLAPGTYTLRLLLADQQHLPYFVYSKPTVVKVTKKNAVDPASLVKKGIEFLNLPANGQLRPPFKLQFHASALNVAHESQKEKDTGHFRLTLSPRAGGKPVELDFVDGQTETMLAPPKGDYAIKLELVDNVNPSRTLVEPVSATVSVL